ncbi:MAG: hypothetical protein J2P54_14960, partial [Bradyrhizobiaceae bacterium]|nr:hypothetical protein [Bradyrhizobiaceae bacterium]
DLRRPIGFDAVLRDVAAAAAQVIHRLTWTGPSRAQHYDSVNDFEPILLIAFDQTALMVSKGPARVDLSGLFAG